jgi:hypothetical protein
MAPQKHEVSTSHHALERPTKVGQQDSMAMRVWLEGYQGW